MATRRRELLDLLVASDLVRIDELRPNAPTVEVACVDGVPPQLLQYDFVRTLVHRDWVDGESLVQAGKTPDEDGMNDRFHKIEADLDRLGENVRRTMMALNNLRAQLRVCLGEIVAALAAANKDDAKDAKEDKEAKENKEAKEQKEDKDTKEDKDSKDGKEDKEAKEAKEAKEEDDKPPKEETKDTLGAKEKDRDHNLIEPSLDHRLVPDGGASLPTDGVRVFITPDERPGLGVRAMNAPREE